MSENLYKIFFKFQTHTSNWFVFCFKFWKFIMLQLFIHFDMIANGGGRWCYLPNLFKQVHIFFYSIYWRDCYYLLATDHLVKHSDTETSFFGEGGRSVEWGDIIRFGLFRFYLWFCFFVAIISMNFRNWHHFCWG